MHSRHTRDHGPVAVTAADVSWILASFDPCQELSPRRRTCWWVVVLLQVRCPISDTTHGKALVSSRALGLDIVVHVSDPLRVVVDKDVAVTRGINEVLVHPARVGNDLVDLSVGDVASGLRAFSWACLRVTGTSQVSTLRSVASGFGHGERSAIAGDANDDLVRWHCRRRNVSALYSCIVYHCILRFGLTAGLSDHDQRTNGLGEVNVTTETQS